MEVNQKKRKLFYSKYLVHNNISLRRLKIYMKMLLLILLIKK